MTQRGGPGEQGEPGHEGEPGKDTGEGGRGGEGGLGGRGGAGAPEGPGGPGGEGGEGGRGARGERGEAGPAGEVGPQPRLRWAPAIGYLLLALVLGFLIWQNRILVNQVRELTASNAVQVNQVRDLTRANAAQAKANCEQNNADKLADFKRQQASRKFLEDIADIEERVAKTASDRAAGRIVAERAAFWRGLADNIPTKPPPPADCEFKP